MDKKIEPTDAMVADVLAAKYQLDLMNVRDILRVALNHPDARGLFTDEDDRPWEPLNEGDPLNVGDEVRRDYGGVTITAVVASVDGGGDPWAAEGGFIGPLRYGTWYVRRTVQELPTEIGTVIVPAEGHEYIEFRSFRSVWRANEAVLGPDGRWHGVWRNDSARGAAGPISPEVITPGTWKVDDQ